MSYLSRMKTPMLPFICQLLVITNQEIGQKLGLTYLAVSLVVYETKEILNNDKELEEKNFHINHQSRFDT